MGRNIEAHDFYCMNCGNKNIPLPRPRGHRHAAFHRKKMYCIYCKTDLNFMEIKNDEEYEVFKKQFNKGMFVNEAMESMKL